MNFALVIEDPGRELPSITFYTSVHNRSVILPDFEAMIEYF